MPRGLCRRATAIDRLATTRQRRHIQQWRRHPRPQQSTERRRHHSRQPITAETATLYRAEQMARFACGPILPEEDAAPKTTPNPCLPTQNSILRARRTSKLWQPRHYRSVTGAVTLISGVVRRPAVRQGGLRGTARFGLVLRLRLLSSTPPARSSSGWRCRARATSCAHTKHPGAHGAHRSCCSARLPATAP
jgi:hypothetical protein